MKNSEILEEIVKLIEYCKDSHAKRSVIITSLKNILEACNSNLPFD